MNAREKVLKAYRAHLGVGRARQAEMMRVGVEARSLGAYVWDEAGERYLDCGGYGVFILGHCHPRVVEAVIAQIQRHPLTTYFLLNRCEAEAAETLSRVAPAGLDHVHFACSGAEAVEAALKLARLNGRRRVIAMTNGYHGMTLGALSVTGRDLYQRPFDPLLRDIEFVPFGNIGALEEVLSQGPQACVVLEPVQAEGGVIIPPDGYLSSVEKACRRHGAFLVLDEVQTGLGRLGRWWGADRESVVPDALVVGKALSGGVVPVSAVLASSKAFGRLNTEPLLHTSTFSGAPIAVAAARATIETIEAENIVDRAASLGARVLAAVAGPLTEVCPDLVPEVRGLGLLIGIEWATEYLAVDFLMEMLDRRVILAHSMNTPLVTRLTPPAILVSEEVDMLEAAVRASARALVAR